MDVLDQLAVALGFATLAGLNLYLTVLVTGMAIRFHWIELLPQYEGLGVLAEWPVLAVAGVFFLLEFFADKIPWVDSLWDMFHTLIRPVGGALLALQTLGETAPAFDVVIALAAGSATLVTHGFKASARLAINASPEPVSNIVASVAEDAAVVGGLVLMKASPTIALFVFGTFLGFVLYLTPILFRRIVASLWLFSRKLRAPAAGKEKTPREFSSKITSDEDVELSIELAGRDPDVAWAVPALTGRTKGLRGLSANLFGKLVAENSRPGLVFFVGRKNRATFVTTIPLTDCRFSHEPRFLSEDLVIYNKKSKLKFSLRFPRTSGALVETLIPKLEALQSQGAESALGNETLGPAEIDGT